MGRETSLATGIATGTDGGSVAERATTTAREGLAGERVDFCQAFCSASLDTAAVVEAIRSVIGPDAALIGCTSTGEFTETSSVHDGVAVGLVASDSISFHVGLGTNMRENIPGTIREALADVPSSPAEYPYRSAITLHDGLQGVGERLALVAQRKLGPEVQFAGGAASDRYQLDATRVFCGDRVAENAVAIAVLDSVERPVMSVGHGHVPISAPMTVTGVDGNAVTELDGKPAYDAWCDAVREKATAMFDLDVDDVEPGTEAHTRLMGAFEFGIDQGEDFKIRWPRVEQPDPDSGAITFAVEIPEGTELHVMEGTVEAQIESAREAARDAHDLADGEYAGGFVYDCACREIILGEQFPTAVEAIAEELDGPFAGFETYGEFCMDVGKLSGFHNATTVIQLLPK